MGYVKTMIRVAPDSPTHSAIIPISKDGKKTVAVLEYDLLIGEPFAVHAMHKNIFNTELEAHLIDLYAVNSPEYQRLTQLEVMRSARTASLAA
jgi:hypothetical protein